ncbi:MAG TPA: hypothetical protein VK978_01740 [Candidatus Saccharimonadales bacterium]|nr:hypothetical protein [Candidatus Saccharimonadales bacterium]
MKQKDIPLILIIVIVSGMISFFAARMLFTTEKDRTVAAEVVDPISAEFTQPSNQYFNSNALNPTLQIQIGDNVNINPFNNQ